MTGIIKGIQRRRYRQGRNLDGLRLNLILKALAEGAVVNLIVPLTALYPLFTLSLSMIFLRQTST